MFLPRRKIRIETDRLTLRQPVLTDFRDWSSLRESSADFLTPWEPQWAADHLSRKHSPACEARCSSNSLAQDSSLASS